MRSNRRSVLIGLGTLTVGGGAVFGTGAFNSVDADRSISVSLAEDSNAVVAFTNLDGDYVSANGDGAIEIDVTDVNVEATLTVNTAFEIQNNHSEEITLDVTDGSWEVTENNITIELIPAETTVGTDGSTAVDLEIDTSGASNSDSIDSEITISVST